MLKVFVAQNPVQAHLVQGILEAEGIDAEVRGEALFTTLQGGSAMPATLPTVWISDDDQAIQARALVERFSGSELPVAVALAPWLCADCGELHEPQFTQCWNCGSPKP